MSRWVELEENQLKFKPVQRDPFVLLRCDVCYAKDGSEEAVSMNAGDDEGYAFELGTQGTCGKCKTRYFLDLISGRGGIIE